MWPSQRQQEEGVEEEEEEVLPIVQSPWVAPKPEGDQDDEDDSVLISTPERSREQAILLKKKKEEEKRLKELAVQKRKKQEAKKRREKAKKTNTHKKKKKKVWKPDEIEVGDVVLVAKGIAITRWKGVLHFRQHDGLWLGVEFVDGPFGKNDGKVQGKRYFKTKKKNHGSFVKQITRKLKPEDLLRKLGTVQSQLKARQEALEETHAVFTEYKQKEEQRCSMLNLKTPMSKVNLLDQLSGNLEQYASESPDVRDIMVSMKEMDDDTSSEYEYSDSDEDLPETETPIDEEEYQRRKGARKNLLLASQTDLYREGSLRKIQQQMKAQMDVLKKRESDAKSQRPLLKTQSVSGMGLILPEKNASPEEVSDWIRENLTRAPGHPDMEDPKIMQALTWTLSLFLKVQDNFSF